MTTNLPSVVLDTTVLSYIFNRDRRAHYYEGWLRNQHLVISFQTLEEAWFGAHQGRWGQRRMYALEGHLQRYQVIWPNEQLVEVCARLRADRRAAGRELQMQDAWIVSTALYLGCPLASNDGIFVDIPNLELVRDPSTKPPFRPSPPSARTGAGGRKPAPSWRCTPPG